ncbi:hypothetical protein H8356DRAFT_1270597 [Neocallimastix lanati (nom. inval.)]|nr:hypothetical protein H8356DRAFT_1270597 [Neocallimastix sp. JGI-2020a]
MDKSLVVQSKLCIDDYCSLKINNGIVYYIQKNGSKTILVSNENKVTLSSYGQISLVQNKKLIGKKGSSDKYIAKCNSDSGIINIYDSNNKIAYYYPDQNINYLSNNNALIENTQLCTDGYCCLEINNGNVYYIQKNGSKNTIGYNENKITLSAYGQISLVKIKYINW